MLSWLLTEVLPLHWQIRIGERLFGAGFHAYLCPCGENWTEEECD